MCLLQIRFFFSLSCGNIRYLIRTFSKKMFPVLRACFSGRKHGNRGGGKKKSEAFSTLNMRQRLRKKERQNPPSCFGKNRFGLGEVLV